MRSSEDQYTRYISAKPLSGRVSIKDTRKAYVRCVDLYRLRSPQKESKWHMEYMVDAVRTVSSGLLGSATMG